MKNYICHCQNKFSIIQLYYGVLTKQFGFRLELNRRVKAIAAIVSERVSTGRGRRERTRHIGPVCHAEAVPKGEDPCLRAFRQCFGPPGNIWVSLLHYVNSFWRHNGCIRFAFRECLRKSIFFWMCGWKYDVYCETASIKQRFVVVKSKEGKNRERNIKFIAKSIISRKC